MKKNIRLIGCLLLVGLVVVGQSSGSRMTADEIEELADLRVAEGVSRALDLRAVASGLGISWPVVPPCYSFDEHVHRSDEYAKSRARETYPDSKLLDLISEADEKFRPIKVGDQVEIRSIRPPHRIYKGAVQRVTPDAIRIGNYGQLSTKDIDPDTLARFSEAECETRKRNYLRVQREVFAMNRKDVYDREFPVKLKTSLLADGYVPKDPNERSKAYFVSVNWEAISDRYEAACLEKKRGLEEELEEEILVELYESNGFALDGNRWRRLSRIHDFPLSGKHTMDRSFLERIRGE